MDNNKTNFVNRFKEHPLEYIILIVIVGVITFFVSTCKGPKVIIEEGPYAATGDPGNIIDFNEIEDLYFRYDQRAKLIENAEKDSIPGFKAARAITFKYQEIKNYLKFIEDNSLEAKIRISGLRFYFGKYPNDTTKNKKGRQLLFFNPTVDTLLQGDQERKELAYAIDRRGSKVSIKFLNEIIKKPKDTATASLKNIQENEASVLSFLNFNTVNGLKSQMEQGGQHSPPPPPFQ